MQINRHPSNLDYTRINGWNSFCNDVDGILISATNIYRFGIFVIYFVLLGAATLLSYGLSYGVLGDNGTFYILFGLLVVVTLLLYIFTMVRYNRQMNHLENLLRDRSGNRVRYKLENERSMLFMKI